MKFRLKAGKHSQDKRVFKPGEIVENDSDLAKRFGAEKFERVDDSGSRPRTHRPGEEEDRVGLSGNPLDRTDSGSEDLEPSEDEITGVGPDELGEMTVQELKDLADSEEIDLGDAHLKADILKKVRGAVNARKNR